MKRHPFNLLSLMFGIFLIGLAAWTTWFVFPIRAWVIDFSRWLLPAAAILVGAALLSPLFTSKPDKKSSGDETEGYVSGEAYLDETGDGKSGLEAGTPADRP